MELLEELNTDFWILAKIAVLIFLGIYVVFSTVVVKQSRLMAETLDVELDNFIVFVSYVHLIFSIIVFIASVVLL